MLINLDDFSRMLKIERNYSENTISAYLSDLKSFNVFLEKNKINFKDVINDSKHIKRLKYVCFGLPYFRLYFGPYFPLY